MPLKRPIKTAVEGVASNANYTLNVLRADARALIAELQDGMTIRVIRDPSSSHNIMDFVLGKCDELPIAFKIEPKEQKA